MEKMYFNYTFKLNNGEEKKINVKLDNELNLIEK